MSKTEPPPVELSDDPLRQRIYQLLRAADYELAAELLSAAQREIEHQSHGAGANILAVAQSICLACSHCRAEGVWFGQAQAEAERLEAELKQELEDLLSLLNTGETIAEAYRLYPSLATLEPKRSAWCTIGLNQSLNLWQCLRRWLKRKVKPHKPRQDAPPASAEVLTIPPSGDPSLIIHCLGPFRVYQDDQPVQNWPGNKGRSIFKYIVAHRERPVSKEVLMDLFWPEADPEAARNNLNVAIHNLRQSFKAIRSDFPYILFHDDHYFLNSALVLWVDFNHFIQAYQAGQRLEKQGQLTEALRQYELAEGLYQGDFLEEDLYEDWPILQRESLKDNYLIILERLSRNYFEEKQYGTCIHLCQKILAKDDCREDAHRRMMRCYYRQGQPTLALRQYHICVETLDRVLEVSPAPDTTALYQQIRKRESI